MAQQVLVEEIEEIQHLLDVRAAAFDGRILEDDVFQVTHFRRDVRMLSLNLEEALHRRVAADDGFREGEDMRLLVGEMLFQFGPVIGEKGQDELFPALVTGLQHPADGSLERHERVLPVIGMGILQVRDDLPRVEPCHLLLGGDVIPESVHVADQQERFDVRPMEPAGLLHGRIPESHRDAHPGQDAQQVDIAVHQVRHLRPGGIEAARRHFGQS